MNIELRIYLNTESVLLEHPEKWDNDTWNSFARNSVLVSETRCPIQVFENEFEIGKKLASHLENRIEKNGYRVINSVISACGMHILFYIWEPAKAQEIRTMDWDNWTKESCNEYQNKMEKRLSYLHNKYLNNISDKDFEDLYLEGELQNFDIFAKTIYSAISGRAIHLDEMIIMDVAAIIIRDGESNYEVTIFEEIEEDLLKEFAQITFNKNKLDNLYVEQKVLLSGHMQKDDDTIISAKLTGMEIWSDNPQAIKGKYIEKNNRFISL